MHEANRKMDLGFQLRKVLQPLVGATVLEGYLIIFPTAPGGNLQHTDTSLYLHTTVGDFIFGLQVDGQSPLVMSSPNLKGELININSDFSTRLDSWQNAADGEFVNQETFRINEFVELAPVLGATVQGIALYSYISGELTGLQIIFPELTIYSVPGACGNLILTNLSANHFIETVREIEV